MKNAEFKTHCFICNRRVMIWIMALALFVIALLILLPAATVSFQQKPEKWEESFVKPSQQITVANTNLTVAVADSNAEITQGLSNREKLQKHQGLLFIFHDTDYRTFWMKDMKFAIDMIFIRDGVIVDIAKNMTAPRPLAVPATYKSQSPADMVLEVNAGLSERYGWEAGDAITISK